MVIEDGSGVVDANSYTNEIFALAYLTDRGREAENLWSTLDVAQQQAALIQATDYIEQKFGLQFRGSKEFTNLELAKGVLTFLANPLDADTVIIGSVTYIFNTSLGAANSILIGDNASNSLDNLIAAINFTDGIGIKYGTGTIIHPDVEVGTFVNDAVVIFAKIAGVASNSIISTTTVTDATWSNSTLTGGTDTGQPQPLSFPRLNLFDQDGTIIVGIPIPLKQATVEYAVRSVSITLEPDPSNAGSVINIKEKVGVIEEETTYSENNPRDDGVQSYPAADRLLRQYITTSGRTIRA